MYTITPVTGHIGGECYLLEIGGSAVLLDAGYAFSAAKAAENISAVLGDRPLDAILASHSHYDHLSGAAIIKRAYLGARVVCSRHARDIARKPSARELMFSLNAGAAAAAGLPMPEDCLDGLAVDTPLEDGEELLLPGGGVVRAVASPGHTRCALNYYFPEEGLLVCSETLGIAPRYPEVIPCLIVGYRMTLDSIERARRLRPRRVFVAHRGLLPEGEEEAFFDASASAAAKLVGIVLSYHDAGRSREELYRALYQEFYLPTADIQPERAFVLNTEALIPRVLKELGR